MKKLSLIALIALAACSKQKVTVALDKSSEDNLPMDITIDDTMKIHLVSDTSFNITLLEGKHELKAKNLSKTFEVKAGGGIINLDNTEYVLYGIEYSRSKLGLFGGKKETPVIIDSFIVFKNRQVLDKVVPMSDKKLQAMLPEIEKNVNTPGHREKAKFMKVGKDQFYIDKFWDFNLNDQIPESIEVKGISGTKTKYAVMRARHFLFSVLLAGDDEYGARTLSAVQAGLYDKEQEMAKDSLGQEQEVPDQEIN